MNMPPKIGRKRSAAASWKLLLMVRHLIDWLKAMLFIFSVSQAGCLQITELFWIPSAPIWKEPRCSRNWCHLSLTPLVAILTERMTRTDRPPKKCRLMYECRSFLCWHGGDEASSSRDGKGRWRQGETSVHASHCPPGKPEAEGPILDRRMQRHGSLGTVSGFTVYTLRPGCIASHHQSALWEHSRVWLLQTHCHISSSHQRIEIAVHIPWTLHPGGQQNVMEVRDKLSSLYLPLMKLNKRESLWETKIN